MWVMNYFFHNDITNSFLNSVKIEGHESSAINNMDLVSST